MVRTGPMLPFLPFSRSFIDCSSFQNFAQGESVDPEALLIGDRWVWQRLCEFQVQLLVQQHQSCGCLDGSRLTELEEILWQTVA